MELLEVPKNRAVSLGWCRFCGILYAYEIRPDVRFGPRLNWSEAERVLVTALMESRDKQMRNGDPTLKTGDDPLPFITPGTL